METRDARAARIALVVAAAGCTVPPPFHMLETASTLPARGVSVMVAGGGGVGEGLDSCCGGAAARVRVGIGNGQEVRVDGSTIFSSNSLAGGFRLGYKIAPSGRLAVLAGAGAFFTEAGSSAGADLGVIVSARANGRPVIPYAGARLSAAIPADHGLYERSGTSGTLTIPIGVSRRLGAHWQALLELGGVGAISKGELYDDGSIHTQTNLGLYGALAIEWQR
jgi:hypothetical protein